MDLNFSEKFIVFGLRTFSEFLQGFNYHIHSVTYLERDGDHIQFKSNLKRQEIIIAFSLRGDALYLDLVFNRNPVLFKQMHFALSDVIEHFVKPRDGLSLELTEDNILDRMELCLSVIKKNLVPVLKGNEWIDEILERVKQDK